ncbi:MAG TPA: hypothetical protein VNQ73_14485 [Ilumatobacter sp.]|nr:hypothetical protein [Ilumatobacter sp.]
MGHLTIACDDCTLRHSTACADCVVTFVLQADNEPDGFDALELDADQERVVHLFVKAGLVPVLRHRAS